MKARERLSQSAMSQSLKHKNNWHPMEGIFAAPEGAATLAALRKLIENKWVQPEENIVLFNTGSGLKYLEPKKRLHDTHPRKSRKPS